MKSFQKNIIQILIILPGGKGYSTPTIPIQRGIVISPIKL
jgi:hypothetical protein